MTLTDRQGPPAGGRAPLPLALTMGEPAGIGGEIALKCWLSNPAPPGFFLVGDMAYLKSLRDDLGLDVPLREILSPAQAAAVFPDALPVFPCPLSGDVSLGSPSVATASSVIHSVELAVRFARRGSAAGVVTNPIQKSVLYDSGFRFAGHTEFLAELTGVTSNPVMMLACAGLRVVPVTIHVGLRGAIDGLTPDVIVEHGRILALSLRRDFAIAEPVIAVAGLNPHAGEAGAMGDEEETIIGPAVDILKADGIDVRGPYQPDTLFTEAARSTYDAALCMYHDQALIPIKTLDFAGAVNITLGLPIIRTSPDHGTASEIAGRGVADPRSLANAMVTARRMAANRAPLDGASAR